MVSQNVCIEYKCKIYTKLNNNLKIVTYTDQTKKCIRFGYYYIAHKKSEESGTS
jgi:hypothetical protein